MVDRMADVLILDETTDSEEVLRLYENSILEKGEDYIVSDAKMIRGGPTVHGDKAYFKLEKIKKYVKRREKEKFNS